MYTAFNLAQAVYLYIGFIQGIDRELDEAAIIDGCNDVFLLTKILTPICKPIIATETIFVFIYGYGELIFSLILLSKPEKYTVISPGNIPQIWDRSLLSLGVFKAVSQLKIKVPEKLSLVPVSF